MVVDACHLTWTNPAEIDGEPNDVADLVVQQLVDFGAVAAQIAAGSFAQLRAAALEEFQTVEEWEAAPVGQAAMATRDHSLALCSAIRALAR